MEKDEQPFEHRQDKQETHVHLDREIELPVTEEEVVASTHEVERGSIRIDKRLVEEEVTIDVPVTEEEAAVTRRAVDREIDPASHDFEEGTITVPVMGEEVDVEKRAHVVEEIDIRKTPVTHTEEVTETVRREQVEIGGDDIDLREREDQPGEDDTRSV